ncbi:MAG: FAD:protein FMN transferase [Bacteroidota bacterium]
MIRWIIPILFYPLFSFGQEVFVFEHRQMGTEFKIHLVGKQEEVCRSLAQQAFNKLDSLNRVFSDYDPNSELSSLSQTAGGDTLVLVSPELGYIISQAQLYSQISGGAFDISIGPLSRLWRKAFRRQTFPDSSDLEAAREVVDYRLIEMSFLKPGIRLQKKGMKLDLGGIAKGYSVDLLADLLLREGCRNFLIDGGGDIYANGNHPQKDSLGWEILLPNGQRKYLKNRAVATSGKTYRFLEWQGKRYSHIIDPRTGLGVSHHWTISVFASTCMQADVFASIFSVMGKLKAESFLASNHGPLLETFFTPQQNQERHE